MSSVVEAVVGDALAAMPQVRGVATGTRIPFRDRSAEADAEWRWSGKTAGVAPATAAGGASSREMGASNDAEKRLVVPRRTPQSAVEITASVANSRGQGSGGLVWYYEDSTW